MKQIYVVSDIHGYYDELMDALRKRGFDIKNPEHHLLICGDAFDRGPGNILVFNLIKTLLQSNRLIYIRGNHEDLLLDLWKEIRTNKVIAHTHHFHNKTTNTICDFVKNPVISYKFNFMYYGTMDIFFDNNEIKEINEALSPLIDIIENYTIDYYEIGDYIFTHGWLPCISIKSYGVEKYTGLVPEWRQLPRNSEEWSHARWINGGAAWKAHCFEEDKTIVCGHWHCSWGHSHLHYACKEWPQKNHKDFDVAFEPFYENGITMIDGCTAYSGKVNVLVFEQNQNENIKLLNEEV